MMVYNYKILPVVLCELLVEEVAHLLVQFLPPLLDTSNLHLHHLSDITLTLLYLSRVKSDPAPPPPERYHFNPTFSIKGQ
jgi:hypothetical protein